MSLISMDINQAEETINTMRRIKNEFESQLSNLNRSVQSLQGVWEGSAKNQFDNVWQEWYSSFMTKVNELEPLANGLDTERRQMIEVDSSSNYRG